MLWVPQGGPKACFSCCFAEDGRLCRVCFFWTITLAFRALTQRTHISRTREAFLMGKVGVHALGPGACTPPDGNVRLETAGEFCVLWHLGRQSYRTVQISISESFSEIYWRNEESPPIGVEEIGGVIRSMKKSPPIGVEEIGGVIRSMKKLWVGNRRLD